MCECESGNIPGHRCDHCSNALTKSFVSVLTQEDISNAILYYAVKHSGLPECLFRGVATLEIAPTGHVQATAEITWWPKDPETPADGA